MDMNDAPTQNPAKIKMKQQIENKSKELLSKYFEGRKYDKEKFSKYKTYFLNELTDFLNNN